MDSWQWKKIKIPQGNSKVRLIVKTMQKSISYGQWRFNSFGSGLFKDDFVTKINGKIKNKNLNRQETIITISDNI